MTQKGMRKNINPYDGVGTKTNDVSNERLESRAEETSGWLDKLQACNLRIAERERPIGIKDRYQRIAATDAFKEAYVDRDIGETLEINEDL